MKFVSTKKMKAELSYYLNSLDKTGPIIVTKYGVPKALVIPFTEDDIDSFVLRHSEEVYKMALEAIKEIEDGKTYSVDEGLKKVAEIRKSRED